MPLNRVAGCLAAMAVLCACGGQPTSSQTSTRTRTVTPAACSFTSDSVRPTGTVEIQPPGRPDQRITAADGLPCYTFLRVANSGIADATFVTLGSLTACQLRQNTGSTAQAVLWTREPVPADYLFRLAVGHVACTFSQPVRRVDLCHIGTLSVQGGTQVTALCNRDPSFQVAVYAGLVLVTDASGETWLHSGQVLTFSTVSGSEPPGTAVFSATDLAAFQAQLKEANVAPASQEVRFTSPAPAGARPQGTDQVSAAGGVSGNPVVLAVDPASVKTCTLSAITESFTSTGAFTSATVTYSAAGPCTIDATQEGNAFYQAASQQQLVIPVTVPPPS